MGGGSDPLCRAAAEGGGRRTQERGRRGGRGNLEQGVSDRTHQPPTCATQSTATGSNKRPPAASSTKQQRTAAGKRQHAAARNGKRRPAKASSGRGWEELAHGRGPSSSVKGCPLSEQGHPTTTTRAQAHSRRCLNTTRAGLARRARAHQGPTSPMAQAQFAALPH